MDAVRDELMKYLDEGQYTQTHIGHIEINLTV